MSHTADKKTPSKRTPTPRGRAGAPARSVKPATQKSPVHSAHGTSKGNVRRSVKTHAAGTGATEATASRGRGKGKVVALVLAVVLLVGAVCAFNAYCQVSTNKVKLCEQWRSTVRQACLDTKLNEKWVDSLLALMAVESGGKVDVASVEGVDGDVMQAAEGAYGDIVKKGSRKYGVAAETPESSIYAGALEFKQNLKLWKKYLKGVGVSETAEIQLIVQGYNFGADGWYAWCKKNKVKKYTVEKAQEYSDTMMPEDAKGTPTHGEKWLGFYKQIHG